MPAALQMDRPFLTTIALVALAVSTAPAASLPSDTRQLLVGVTEGWDTTHGRLQCFEREAGGWHAVSPVFPILVGREGLAWGRGVLGREEPGRHKIERDGRAPAGVFRIGGIFGYDAQLPPGAEFTYHQVTAADAWVDDPENPFYNRHVRIDPSAPPPWFDAQRMRLGDPAFHWLIEVRHNSDPPIPGAGSAIFLHTRRGPDRPTAGCTALAQTDLLWIIRWLRAPSRPHFVLLPLSEYERLAGPWGLPPQPGLAAEPSSLGSGPGGR